MQLRGRRVIAIDDLNAVAATLLEGIHARGWSPDLIVGIERGGAEIARRMSGDSGIPLLTMRIQRPSTHSKTRAERVLGTVLRRVPRTVADQARHVEDWWLRRNEKNVESAAPEAPQARAFDMHGDQALLTEARCVLLVDDAIDSGRTLTAASADVRAKCRPEAELVHAVVTRTRPASATAVEPEVVLHEGVLVRFPWALDYRPPRGGR